MIPDGPDWMLVEFAREIRGVRSAVVVSADGLRQATSAGMGPALGDQLAAAASGLISLARGTARLLGAGAVSQTILEMEGGYLFVTAIDESATLAVHTDRRCDLGVIGYEMTLLAARVGHALSQSDLPRSDLPRSDLPRSALSRSDPSRSDLSRSDPSRHALRPHAPSAHVPSAHAPLAHDPFPHAPSAHAPLAPDPFRPAPSAHAPLAHDAFRPAPSAPDPFPPDPGARPPAPSSDRLFPAGP